MDSVQLTGTRATSSNPINSKAVDFHHLLHQTHALPDTHSDSMTNKTSSDEVSYKSKKVKSSMDSLRKLLHSGQKHLFLQQMMLILHVTTQTPTTKAL